MPTEAEVEAAAIEIHCAIKRVTPPHSIWNMPDTSDNEKQRYREAARAAIEAADRARLDQVPRYRTCSVCGQEAHNCKCLSPPESK